MSIRQRRDAITLDQRRKYAATLLDKAECDVTLREMLAALPALQKYQNGASAQAVADTFYATYQEIIE